MKNETRLYIDGRMSAREQQNRINVNTTIMNMKKFDRFSENEFRRWLLMQVTGMNINGIDYVFPETFTYDEALTYFNEIVNTGCFDK